MDKRVLVDTSVLISFYNKGLFDEQLRGLNQSCELFFSAVTINEFIRGAHNKDSKDIVQSFMEIVSDQIVTPTEAQWIECGSVSEQILKGKKRSKEGVLLLQNDILIGLNARDAKAQLVTSDHADFKILKDFIKMSVDFW